MDYDILIIGGGMVGASLACAVVGQGLRIGLVEARPFPSSEHPAYDDRTLALAYGTRRIFQGLGLWQPLAAAVTPILDIHISDGGRPGIARLNHRQEGVEALGYVAEARLIGAVLGERLAHLDGVELLCPASLEDVTIDADAVQVRLQNTTAVLRARLLVAADGADSQVRRQLGIDAMRWDYGQTAVIANVTPEYPHAQVAYERFTDNGPLALLPMSAKRCALVYTVPTEQADAVLNLSDAAFLERLQASFGERLGRFQRTGRRRAHPLTLVKSREHARHRVAIIGNAAHTLHPIAGQGFNLGIRDVAALAEVIVDACRQGEDFAQDRVLQRYADWRRWDQRRTIAFTDGLTRLFSNPLGPLRLARNLGLLAFDLLPPAKHLLARQTMGLEGRLPRLARGLPLLEERLS